MNVKDLKKILENIPDNAEIVYERIEDEYFDEHGWEPIKLLTDPWFNRKFNVDSEDVEESDWIGAGDAFYNKEENKFKITAHY